MEIKVETTKKEKPQQPPKPCYFTLINLSLLIFLFILFIISVSNVEQTDTFWQTLSILGVLATAHFVLFSSLLTIKSKCPICLAKTILFTVLFAIQLGWLIIDFSSASDTDAFYVFQALNYLGLAISSVLLVSKLLHVVGKFSGCCSNKK